MLKMYIMSVLFTFKSLGTLLSMMHGPLFCTDDLDFNDWTASTQCTKCTVSFWGQTFFQVECGILRS